MSRSLDKRVIESLKTSDPIPIYNDISQLLDSPPDDGRLLAVELLGSSHPLQPGVHYLQDGNAVAIPKLRLVQAFFVARKILLSQAASSTCSKAAPSSDSSSSSLDEAAARAALRRATSVILLMDAEHLTAANTRKRLLLSSLAGSGGRLDAGPDPAVVLIKREQAFLDSLLTSHLHRHTKSPTLWSHRRWLVETCQSRGLIVTDIVRDIRQVVTVAANRHPRNYYAWSHARWLVENLLTSTERREERIRVGGEVLELGRDWCFRNHTDTSGWSFLHFMAKTLQLETESVIPPIFQETLRLASSFRWTSESVWVFLRTVAASDLVGERDRADFRDGVEVLKRHAGGEEDKVNILDNAFRWYSDYKISTVSSGDNG